MRADERHPDPVCALPKSSAHLKRLPALQLRELEFHFEQPSSSNENRHRAALFSVEFACAPGSSASGRARDCLEPSSSKLHRAKCGNSKQVAGDVRGLYASKRGGCKSRLEQVAHWFRGRGCDAARIKLLDRFNGSEALRGGIFHRVKVLVGEQSE